MVIWEFVFGCVLFLAGIVVGCLIGPRRGCEEIAEINVRERLKGDEGRLYDILNEQDGVGYFAKISDEYGINRVLLEKIVGGLVGKGILGERVFSYRRKLYLVNYLNALERRVLDFVEEEGGEADVSLIMKKCGLEDHRLIPMGKRFVGMGLIIKVRRGYKTFFVLQRK